MLRELPSVSVSRAFGPALRRRLRGELAVRIPGAIRWSGAVATLLVVATAGLIGWDWLQTRATRRGAAAAWVAVASTHTPVPLMPVAAQPRPLPPMTPVDLPRLPFVTFHPLNAILVIEPSPPAPGQDPVRFDVPAVWGGP
ncbi:MAG TPA: hypothetical protein VEH62_02075 [Gemmatimonadales bacterium]|nr:hypothetical protein [Gemmatimonadales bacterium]